VLRDAASGHQAKEYQFCDRLKARRGSFARSKITRYSFQRALLGALIGLQVQELRYTLYKPSGKVWLACTHITHRKIVLIVNTAICGCFAISHLKPSKILTTLES
jgi:hypothetical protein